MSETIARKSLTERFKDLIAEAVAGAVERMRSTWKYCPYCGWSLLCIDVEEHRKGCCGWPK